jgi:carboxyvinyl-carboxyphosphonate phosphorylmutase
MCGARFSSSGRGRAPHLSKLGVRSDLSRIAKALGSEVRRVCGRHCLISVLGAPDIVLLTLSEFAEHAYRINRASTLPLLVDTDHGYGNGLDVRRTVEELESTGVTRD